MKPSEWNDGEVSYLLLLVSMKGEKAVPENKVASYLRVQATQARVNGRKDNVLLGLGDILELAADHIEHRDDWSGAWNVLKCLA